MGKGAPTCVMRVSKVDILNKTGARFSGMPGIIGNAGCDRPRAWTCDFSSMQSTTAGLWRIQVQPDNVVDLLHEHRVVGQLESVGPVRFELECMPDPADRRGRKTRLLGHRRAGPMGRVVRGGFQRIDHDPFHPIGCHRRHPTRARIIPEPVQPQFKQPLDDWASDWVQRFSPSSVTGAVPPSGRPSTGGAP